MQDAINEFKLRFSDPEQRKFLLSLIAGAEKYADLYSSWFYDYLLNDGNVVEWPRAEMEAECGITPQTARNMEKHRVSSDYLFQKRQGTLRPIHYKGTGLPILWPEQIEFSEDHLTLEGFSEEEVTVRFDRKFPVDLLTFERSVINLRLYEENGEPFLAGMIVEEFGDLSKAAGIAFGKEPLLVISPEGGKAQFIGGNELLERVAEADRMASDEERFDTLAFIRECCEISIRMLKDAFMENGAGVLYAAEIPDEQGELSEGLSNPWLMDAAVKGVMLAIHILADCNDSGLVNIPYGFAESFCPACRHVFVTDDEEEGKIRCFNCGSIQDRQSAAAFNLEWVGRKLYEGATFEELENEVIAAKRRAYVGL